jgi:hypothetical protein
MHAATYISSAAVQSIQIYSGLCNPDGNVLVDSSRAVKCVQSLLRSDIAHIVDMLLAFSLRYLKLFK